MAGLGAYIMWGLLPLYIKAVSHLPPDFILVHRIIWSLPTGLILLWAARQLPALSAALRWAHLKWLAISAALIALNWLLYIWAVSADRVLEASLGYYINPLVNVVIGAVFPVRAPVPRAMDRRGHRRGRRGDHGDRPWPIALGRAGPLFQFHLLLSDP